MALLYSARTTRLPDHEHVLDILTGEKGEDWQPRYSFILVVPQYTTPRHRNDLMVSSSSPVVIHHLPKAVHHSVRISPPTSRTHGSQNQSTSATTTLPNCSLSCSLCLSAGRFHLSTISPCLTTGRRRRSWILPRVIHTRMFVAYNLWAHAQELSDGTKRREIIQLHG